MHIFTDREAEMYYYSMYVHLICEDGILTTLNNDCFD